MKAKLIYSYSETELQTSTAQTTTMRKIISKIAIRFKTNFNLVADHLRRQINSFIIGNDLN